MTDIISRVGSVLLILSLLVWGLVRLARRPRATRGPGVISVLASRQVTRGAAVAVLRIADRALVLGITDHRVCLLTEADLDTIAEHQRGPVVRRQEIPTPLGGPQVASSPLSTDPDGAKPADGTGSDHPAAGGSEAPPDRGALAGSLLSPRTWRQTVEFLRERTARQ